MKRTLKVFVAALAVVALMVAMAMPAFAAKPRGATFIGNDDDPPKKKLNFKGGPGSKHKGPERQHF